LNILHAQWLHSRTHHHHHRYDRYNQKHIFQSTSGLGGTSSSAAVGHHPPSAIRLAMHQFMQGKHPPSPLSVPLDSSAITAAASDAANIKAPPSEPKRIPPQSPPEAAASSNLFPPQNPSSPSKVQNNLATLSCDVHGGPYTKAETQEMVYWHDIPSDTQYTSPRRTSTQPQQEERYMTFEPDGGGWNNIRMAMETVIALALATGRTLVLPAQQRMYLLGKNKGKQRTEFDFDHFFPIYDMAAENKGLKVISMEEFLQRVALKGKLINKVSGQVGYPPQNNRTNWNGQNGKSMEALKDYLRNHTYTPQWLPGKCMAAFPQNETSETAVHRLHGYLTDVLANPLRNPQLDHPPSVTNLSPVDRLRENISHRKQLCIYTPEMQNELVLHFMCSHKLGYRMLVHFYAFLYFESWQEDLWMKRFMRDHIRYKDPIQCAAARIVQALRNEFMGDFDTFHIRRGDFQFKKTRIEATEIYNNVKDILPEGRPVYIATDERNKKFFDPLKEHYQIRFLDDYQHLLEGVNTYVTTDGTLSLYSVL
jgi:hypothetical protein